MGMGRHPLDLEEANITPETIEAGERELSAYDPEMQSSEGAVIDIFLTMMRAKSRACTGARRAASSAGSSRRICRTVQAKTTSVKNCE